MQNAVGKIIGVLGGGQLGKMIAQDAHRLGLKVVVLDPNPNCPCEGVVDKLLVGDFKDSNQVLRLRNEGCTVVTVEIEHINVDSLEALVKAGVNVQPSPSTLRMIQDKLTQKTHLHDKHNLPVAPFQSVSSVEDVKGLVGKFGLPLMLKTRKLAYDGRGNVLVTSTEDVEKAFQLLGGKDLYVEKWVDFVKELSVLVARFLDGTVVTYPVVETIHQNSICHIVYAPAQISNEIAKAAENIAKKAISTLEGAGIFAVELFLTRSGEVLINEIAPRPHNSGHFTIEACSTSQFETHIRAVIGLPPGDTSLCVGAAAMINVLGSKDGPEGMDDALGVIGRALWLPGTRGHWYGKTEAKKGRKMGHITVVGSDLEEVGKRIAMIDSIEDRVVKRKPIVSVIMGSDSDLPKMKDAADILQRFDIPFEVTIVSAHRTPDRMFEFAKGAESRGIQVIIAGAGGAAHLPGMVASLTPLPVIGVPIRVEPLDGTDALHSIVQMPRGVPVATVAINNSTNAGLLAVRIIGSHNASVRQKMLKYQQDMKEDVLKKVDKIQTVGWDKY